MSLMPSPRPGPARTIRPGRAIRATASLCLCGLLSACFGGPPHIAEPMTPIHELGHDWRKHFRYGLDLLD